MRKGKKISHRDMLEADRNYKKTASYANLIYVSDQKEGIRRVKKGKNYRYLYKGKEIKKEGELQRIKKLAIPPSWSEVWICASANGHLQATGLDLLKRKQYRYHTGWNKLRNETKFHHLYEFGKALPQLRRRIKNDISQTNLCSEKVLATVIHLMEETFIRVGNNGYEKMYGSYGLTTLKDKHVKISSDKILFSFLGKKGVEHSITLKNKKLASIVKQCRDIPGKELFQYYDEDGTKKCIDSGMVNDYLKEAAGKEISAKDFRTWAGSLQAIKSFMNLGECEEVGMIKKNVLCMLDEVSGKLGNTRSVCKKYYVHPGLIRLYEENKLIGSLKTVSSGSSPRGLTKDESALMKILGKEMKE